MLRYFITFTMYIVACTLEMEQKKTERTSDVAVFLLCRHNGGWPANLPRWPAKVVYQATMEIGTCCVTSEDLRGATSSGTGTGRESLCCSWDASTARHTWHAFSFSFSFLFFFDYII